MFHNDYTPETVAIISLLFSCGIVVYGLIINYRKYGSFRAPPEERGFNVRLRKRVSALEKTVIELEQKIEKLERQNATQSQKTPGTLGRSAQRRNRP